MPLAPGRLPIPRRPTAWVRNTVFTKVPSVFSNHSAICARAVGVNRNSTTRGEGVADWAETRAGTQSATRGAQRPRRIGGRVYETNKGVVTARRGVPRPRDPRPCYFAGL